jgi:hypothetical protein
MSHRRIAPNRGSARLGRWGRGAVTGDKGTRMKSEDDINDTYIFIEFLSISHSAYDFLLFRVGEG